MQEKVSARPRDSHAAADARDVLRYEPTRTRACDRPRVAHPYGEAQRPVEGLEALRRLVYELEVRRKERLRVPLAPGPARGEA